MIYLLVVFSFLLGAVPFGYITVKLVKGTDIRQFGSGNSGATNVFRVAGPAFGIAVFVLDCFKGFLPVVLASSIMGGTNELYPIIAGLAAISGHIYTPFLGFKGGKGVATGAGVFLGLMPGLTLLGVAVFVISFAISRYVSLSSIIAALFVAVLVWVTKEPLSISLFATLTVMLIIFTHRANIRRLLNGTENRFKK